MFLKKGLQHGDKEGAPGAAASRRAHFRSVSLGQVGGIPTEAYAKSQNASFIQMEKMFWRALDADYQQMRKSGENISALIRPGVKVKVTSSAGTNLSFMVGQNKAEVNCGSAKDVVKASGPANVWLPAGEVYVAIDPTSANGMLVVPSMTYRSKTITNLKLTFKNGKMTDMSADQSVDMIKESMKMSTGDVDVLSLVGYRIKSLTVSHLKVPIITLMKWLALVTLGIGDNSWAGGDVEADNSLHFFLPRATVQIGNNTVVTKGKLSDIQVATK